MVEVNAEQGHHSEIEVHTQQEQFESLVIPSEIDPKLLALWLEREREEIEKNNPVPKTDNVCRGRPLSVLFAAYVGIVVMCFTIALGFLQQKESAEILVSTCKMFLIYSIVGFVIGKFADNYVHESVETLLREIVRRNNTPLSVAPQEPQSES